MYAIQSNSNLLSCRLISAPLNFKLKLFPKDCQAQVFEYFSINFSDRSSIAQLYSCLFTFCFVFTIAVYRFIRYLRVL